MDLLISWICITLWWVNLSRGLDKPHTSPLHAWVKEGRWCTLYSSYAQGSDLWGHPQAKDLWVDVSYSCVCSVDEVLGSYSEDSNVYSENITRILDKLLDGYDNRLRPGFGGRGKPMALATALLSSPAPSLILTPLHLWSSGVWETRSGCLASPIPREIWTHRSSAAMQRLAGSSATSLMGLFAGDTYIQSWNGAPTTSTPLIWHKLPGGQSKLFDLTCLLCNALGGRGRLLFWSLALPRGELVKSTSQDTCPPFLDLPLPSLITVLVIF